uniref:Polypeptide N-acetylgalactosaminyltransferase 2 (Trinotate prediction) n=1 Tax=Myxobolus squamalis TaxID=59785 RepID=A0A6B2G0K5_MYXSQ
MTYWGGENIEISFRLWMCGGGILQDFCSIVGHVFRDASPIKIPNNAVLYNKIRAIEVWMDDYKNIVYNRIGVEKYIPAAGNLESRLKLRQDLKCHSFEWYLKNITPYIRIPGPTTYIQNTYTNMCLDVAHNTESGKHVLVISCHNNGGNQKAFEVSKKGKIYFDGYCLDLSESRPGSKPTFYSCNSKDNQQWIFTERNLVYHSVHNLCLRIHENSKFLSTAICDITDLNQKFKFQYCD